MAIIGLFQSSPPWIFGPPRCVNCVSREALPRYWHQFNIKAATHLIPFVCAAASLVELELWFGTSTVHPDWTPLLALHSLQRLRLACDRSSSLASVSVLKVIPVLRQLSTLRHIFISPTKRNRAGAGWTDDMIHQLFDPPASLLQSVEFIDLRDTQLRSSMLRALAHCASSLQYLHMRAMTRRCYPLLAQFTKFRFLSVSQRTTRWYESSTPAHLFSPFIRH